MNIASIIFLWKITAGYTSCLCIHIFIYSYVYDYAASQWGEYWFPLRVSKGYDKDLIIMLSIPLQKTTVLRGKFKLNYLFEKIKRYELFILSVCTLQINYNSSIIITINQSKIFRRKLFFSLGKYNNKQINYWYYIIMLLSLYYYTRHL